MAVQIDQAIGRGIRRTLSVSGLVLIVSRFLYQTALLGAKNNSLLDFLLNYATCLVAPLINRTLGAFSVRFP